MLNYKKLLARANDQSLFVTYSTKLNVITGFKSKVAKEVGLMVETLKYCSNLGLH